MARKLVENITIIIKAKPSLRQEILEILLAVNQTDHKQKELLKCDIIEVFSKIIDLADNKLEIFDFVEKQKNSSSPKTRKAARNFFENKK